MSDILIVLWAVAVNWLAYKKGFYKLPAEQGKASAIVTNFQLFAIIAIYLLFNLVMPQLLMYCCHYVLRETEIPLAEIRTHVSTGLQVAIMLLLFAVLQWFMASQDKVTYKKIWKDKSRIPSKPAWYDLGLGIGTWFISFPLVSILGSLIELIQEQVFHLKEFEQNAVQFFKTAMADPLSLILAISSVVIAAPLLEEFVFRGIFQTYLKSRVGAKAAILLSALTFALFHYSHGHGYGNITLIFSLLFLGLYLGFLYEKQGSLYASIGLHAAFNSVSVIRLLFFPESA